MIQIRGFIFFVKSNLQNIILMNPSFIDLSILPNFIQIPYLKLFQIFGSPSRNNNFPMISLFLKLSKIKLSSFILLN